MVSRSRRLPKHRVKPDEDARRLHPRLRVYANCDEEVNALRADLSAAVASTIAPQVSDTVHSMADEDPGKAQRCQLFLSPESVAGQALKLAKSKRLKTRPASNHAFVNVFVQFMPAKEGSKAKVQAVAERKMTARLKSASSTPLAQKVGGAFLARRNFVSATIPVAMLEELKTNDAVAFVHPAEPLKLDLPISSKATEPLTRSIKGAASNWKAKGVLIGIIDVGGFDFAHPDFLTSDGKGTRFHSIWDQGSDLRASPKGFTYGALITQDHMNAAIKSSSKKGGLPAHLLESQSQQVEGSHGTHVASIAAGNKGVCPDAVIAAVLIDVPQPKDERDRRRSTFSDSSRIVHAVEHLVKLAEELGLPLSVNISLGTNGGAHDGSSGPCRWIDSMLSTPGRAVCVAAGNAGQESAEREDDFGWVMGRIHTSGSVPSKGLEVDLDWTVIGNGIADVSENELELWYSPQDRISVLLQPPGSKDWFEVKPGEFIENHRLASGTRISIYNEVYHPTNGSNYIAIYLTPNLKQSEFIGVQAGVWRVRLRGDDIREGSFHGWIERDDPNEIGRQGGMRLFRFPSFFSTRTNVDSHSINSLACAHRVIGVANIDDLRQKIHVTSSQGPTRDGRLKPDICAPGTNIVAANGFVLGESRWTEMTGTSMASPYVTGVIALMLAKEPGLTAAQCLGILQRTSQPIPGASYKWQNDAGFGRIAPEKAIEEAVNLNARKEVEAFTMKLKIFQSNDGDCLLLESADSKRILCDGGRSTSMREHVRDELTKLRKAKQIIDIAYISHVDADHITGILALLQDELEWRIHDFRVENGIKKAAPKVPRPPEIGTVWHNAFRDQVGKNDVNQIESLLAAAVPTLNGTGVKELEGAATELGDLSLAVADALQVSNLLSPDLLDIPVNALPKKKGKPKLLMLRKNQKAFGLGTLAITIVGPGKGELENLAKGWNTWLRENSERVKETRAQMKKRVDEFSAGSLNGALFDLREWNGIPDYKGVSAPNIASLMLMVEEGTKRVLLTGDGQQEFILQGLESTGYISSGGAIHLDVLKVQHHGSENNLNADFCKQVSADHYVFCGNGAHGNPELSVINDIFNSRCGTKSQLARDPKADGRSFTFWFSTTSKAQKAGSEELKIFKAVEKEVEKLRKQAKGQMKVRFNSGAFSTLSL